MKAAPSIIRPARRHLPTLAWLLAFLVAAATATASPLVHDLRLGEHPEYTRFVLEMDSPLDFRVYTLGDPYRVVIDLPEVGWRLPKATVSRAVGLVTGFRYGLFRPGQSRVVIDAKRPVGLRQALVLPPRKGLGFRFVLDLMAVDRASFLKRTGLGGMMLVQAVPMIDEPLVEDAAPPPLRAAIPLPKPSPATAARTAANPRARMLARLPVPRQKPLQHLRRRVVVLDPGHGGIDPGATGVNGIHEKHITLAMARAVKDGLEAVGGFKVMLTRNRDVFIRLRDRVSFARDAGAELFVSLHADSIGNPRIRGLSVYTLSEKASDREAALLAEKENKADLIAGVDLSLESEEVTNILIDLARRETMNQSVQLAGQLVDALARETKMLRNSHRFAGFAVLKAPDVPSVLVELGFLSNRRDETALRDPGYRDQLARSITRGIVAYFKRVEEANRR